MVVEILFTRGCPNHAPTVAIVQQLVRDLGVEAEIREIEVRGADDAQQLRFLGSPSIRVDGRDIEALQFALGALHEQHQARKRHRV